jgi:hypothetical protein
MRFELSCYNHFLICVSRPSAPGPARRNRGGAEPPTVEQLKNEETLEKPISGSVFGNNYNKAIMDFQFLQKAHEHSSLHMEKLLSRGRYEL